MSAFSREPVAMISASEARALWQKAKLTSIYRSVAGEESSPVYQALTALYRVCLLDKHIAEHGIEPRHHAASEEPEYWTTEQLARASGRAARTIRNDINDGELPATKTNAGWIITNPEARTYIARH